VVGDGPGLWASVYAGHGVVDRKRAGYQKTSGHSHRSQIAVWRAPIDAQPEYARVQASLHELPEETAQSKA
jgi:hypothetical protein